MEMAALANNFLLRSLAVRGLVGPLLAYADIIGLCVSKYMWGSGGVEKNVETRHQELQFFHRASKRPVAGSSVRLLPFESVRPSIQ